MEEAENIGVDFQSFAEGLVGTISTVPETTPAAQEEGSKEPENPLLTVEDVEKQLAAIISPEATQKPETKPAPVAEVKPEVVEPTKPAETVSQTQDRQPEWWEKPSNTEKAEPQESIEEWKRKYEELNSKLASVENDELINLHLKFKDTEGYDFKKLIESFKTEDKSASSVEDLYEEYLRKNGKDDDVITSELMKLESKTEIERDSLKADLLNRLTPEKKENPYLELLNQNAKKQQEEYDKYIQIVTKARETAHNFANNLVGKEIAGFKIDDQVTKTVLNSFEDKNFWLDEKGNPDPIKETMSRLWTIYGPSIVKSAIDKAKAEVIDSRTRPSANNAPAASAPPVLDPRSKAEGDFEAYLKG